MTIENDYVKRVKLCKEQMEISIQNIIEIFKKETGLDVEGISVVYDAENMKNTIQSDVCVVEGLAEKINEDE